MWVIRSNISIHLKSHMSPDLVKSFFSYEHRETSRESALDIVCFGLRQTGNIWLFSCKILHDVHKPFVNFVCLLFCAGYVLYGGFLELSS